MTHSNSEADWLKEAEKIGGWMSTDELKWLHEKASHMSSVIEIGSWKGRSAYALASGCTGTVLCVDHFMGSPSELSGAHAEANHEDIYASFQKNVGHFQNIRCFRVASATASELFLGPDGSRIAFQIDGKYIAPDMVFIDGKHTYEAAKADIEAWRPLARKLFCGHDRTQDGVPKALKDCGVDFKEGPGSIWYVEVDNQ